MTVSDELLIAYVDGELSDAARREVDHAAQEDAAVAAQLAAHKRLRAGLAEAYVPVLDEAVPEALLAAVMATDNHKVSSFTPRRRSLPAWSHWPAMAA